MGQAAQLDHLPLSLPNTSLSLSLSSLTPNNPLLSRPNSGASGSYDSDTYQLPEGSVPVKIKDEPDDRSVDDDDDDDRVAQLKTENTDLAAVVKKMKSSVAVLKQEVLEHVNSGCEIRMTDANAFS